MNEILATAKKYLSQIVELWTSLPPRRRLVLAAVGVAVLGAISIFVWRMNDRAYRPLYTELGESEAGVAVTRLQEMGVPYRLASGGTTILVPESQLDGLRLQMASEGLPSTGRMGFEIFDQSSFGATEFAEQVNFRRGLEGELERTIASLDEIKRARVHVSLPKRSVFLDSDQAAKASVVVELEAGRELTKEQSRAISYLVASAVEGLQPDSVVIMDNLGRLFSKRYWQAQDLTEKQLEYRRNVESDTVRKITETLEPHLGPGGMRANAFVEVDWDSGEQTEEILDPSPVAMSSQLTEEQTADDLTRGAPGTATNLPRQPEAPENRQTGASRKTETTNYQTSRTVTRLSLERGSIKRMSIAVLVDHRVVLNEEKRVLERVPRESEELDTIRELVWAASGAMRERGDVVTVSSLPFHMLEEPPRVPEPPPDPADEILSLEWLRRNRLELMVGVVALGIVSAVFWFFRRRRRNARIRAEREAAITAERERQELEAAHQAEQEKQAEEEARMLKGLKVGKVHSSKTQVLKRHLEEMAGDNPEGFARLMKTWIHEDD